MSILLLETRDVFCAISFPHAIYLLDVWIKIHNSLREGISNLCWNVFTWNWSTAIGEKTFLQTTGM